MIRLRNYQTDAVNAVYEHLRTRDDNPCVVIPTGGGKTPVMAQIAMDAVGRWDGRVLVLAHVKELLEQTSETLAVMAPELDVGVYCAGLNSRDRADGPPGVPDGDRRAPLRRHRPAVGAVHGPGGRAHRSGRGGGPCRGVRSCSGSWPH